MTFTTWINSLREAGERATKGPFEIIRYDSENGFINYAVETEIRNDREHVIVASFSEFGNGRRNKLDAEYFCLARNEWDTMLTLLERYREALETILKNHSYWNDDWRGGKRYYEVSFDDTGQCAREALAFEPFNKGEA